jgi:very-short-patch-repair endonuclease
MNISRWMTHKEIAELFGTTQQAVCLQAASLRSQVKEPFEQIVERRQFEGTRLVTRRRKCIDIQIVHAMAINSRKFQVAGLIRKWAEDNSIRLVALVVPRLETKFGHLLDCLSGICTVVPQQIFGKYLVDFYIPQIGLAVEYDEKHHRKLSKLDKLRQDEIMTNHHVEFLRVREGEELTALRTIIDRLFHARPPASQSSRIA